VCGKCSTEGTWVINVERGNVCGKCSKRGTWVVNVQEEGRGW